MVVVDPVVLQDVTIGRATAHNAKYVVDEGIGPGTRLRITRSKDVIPYIVEVTKSTGAALPDVPYRWDANRVNLLSRAPGRGMCVKLIASFFAKLGTKHVSEKTVEKLYASGLDNLMKILGASKARLMRVDGIQQRGAERIHDNIHSALQNVKPALVVGASGVLGYGIGRKRVEALLLDIPDLFSINTKTKKAKKELLSKILSTAGFSVKTAGKVLTNIPHAQKFLKLLSRYATFASDERVSDSLKGKVVVMTGFRDRGMEEAIAARGGKVTSAVSRNTTVLVVAKKGGAVTGKIKKAQDLGTTVMDREEFSREYLGS